MESDTKRRHWTAEEDETLRSRYKTVPAIEIAEQLGRTARSVYVRAAALGLSQQAKFASNDQVREAIKRRHKDGFSDREIADELAVMIDGQVDRHRVGDIRRKMGLASNATSERRRQLVAKKTKQQLKEAGVNSLADLRSASLAKWKDDLGWPRELTTRAVQALELFHTFGPMTRVQLCRLMGVSPVKRTNPVSNAKGGTILAELARAGLIARLPKQVPNGRGAKGRIVKVDIYCLVNGVEPDGRKRKRRTEGQPN